MGNFEKLVVLTVIFLSIIVLAVSLNGGDDEAKQKQGPLAAAQDRLGGKPGGSAGVAALPEPGAPLLSSEVAPGAATERDSSTAVDRRVKVLVDGPGLSPSAFPDYMEYRAAPGDTWSLLALRFYRDERGGELLMSANEEMSVPMEGAKILVPVFALRLAGEERAALVPSPTLGITSRGGAAPIEASAPNPAGSKSGDLAQVTEYVVMNGDNLSKISKKVYGTANRWQEIYKANQSVLEGPDWLQVGMKLKIPR